MKTINYIIADDHTIFRKGLINLLADNPELNCLGEAENGQLLLDLLKTKKPDVVLLDIQMPVLDGVETLKEIKVHYPNLKVIILTINDKDQYVLTLMEMGASGYLVKDTSIDEVTLAIKSVHENGYYFNDKVSNIMLKKIVNKNDINPTFKSQINLSDVEKEVLRLICKEHTNTEIADKVFKSPRTVEGIRASMLEKIGVRNTAGLVIYAIKNGIYEEEPAA